MNAELYRTIEQNYEKKKAIFEHEYNQAMEEIYSKNQELRKIDEEIKTLGIQASKLSLFAEDEGKKAKVSSLLKKISDLKKKKESILQKEYKSFLPKYDCEKCKDTGYINDGYSIIRCSCMKQKIIDITYNSSNLNNLKSSTFEDFDSSLFSDKKPKEGESSPKENITKLCDLAKEFVKSFNSKETQSLLFIGPTGTGKTFLSSCIANEIIRDGHTVLYQAAPLLLDKIFEFKYSDGNSSAKELYDNVYNTDLLIIDDLGAENSTPAKFTELFNIINTRLLDPTKKTIISTNFDLEKLSKVYDSRLIYRFIGNYRICKFFGDDIRLSKKN